MRVIQSTLAVVLATGIGAAGCAHQERRVVELTLDQAQDLKDVDLHRESVIFHLRQGDVVPLEVVIEGGLVTAAPGASVTLTVKRDCWVRVDDRGIRLSEDGKSFDAKPRTPGAFQLGLGASPTGPRATLKLTTPAR